MIDPRDDLPPGLHASIERNTQALTRAFSAVLPAAVKALAPPSRGRTPTAPPRPAHEGEHTMSTPTEPNMQIIENASSKDVRPGDHITWKWVQEIDGVTVKSSHEGIAHHQDGDGNWWTEGGMWLTSGDAGTLTIRRTIQDLPTASCAVIVPADGRERVEAMANVVWYASEAVLGPDNRWHGVWRTDSGLAISSVGPEEITPGTWKVQPMSAAPPECECPEAPEHLWTTHYGAADPGSMIEHNPECPVHRVDPQDSRLPDSWARALNNPDTTKGA